ncbi:MAG: PspC domain-containing protein [Rhodococcus sp. (in: high G+C Gram-positive bacteria)]
MTTAPASTQLSELWRTRPVRLPDHGPGAGIAAGIGHRYRVDPVLIRVAFVVATVFGGSGLVLYLAAWLVLPRMGETVSAADSLLGRGRASVSHTSSIVLTVALVIAVVSVGPIGRGSGLISTLAMLGGLYLLYRRTPTAPTPEDIAGRGAAAAPQTSTAWNTAEAVPDQYQPTPPPVSLSKDGDRPPTPTSPPSWDPLGVAPFAWGLPEPGHPVTPVVARPRKSRLTSTVIGVAIIASALTVAMGAGGAATAPRVGGVALAVVGIGLVVGAFTRRGHGLLVVAAPLAGFVVVASLVGTSEARSDGSPNWGNVTAAAPQTMTALQERYESGVGNFTLDLTGLTLTESRTVVVEKAVGNTEITVPADMNVLVDCESAAGNTDCMGSADTIDVGSDGPDAPVLTIEASTAIGNLEVHRG